MKWIKAKGIEAVIYEPVLEDAEFFHAKVSKDLDGFEKSSRCYGANRLENVIINVEDKVYTREKFRSNS